MIPNFMGMKFTNEILSDLTAIGFYKNKKYQVLMARDEELTAAHATGGIDADVSSTINFMSFNLRLGELYNKFDKESRAEMEALQYKTVMVVQTWEKFFPGYNVWKSILKMTGIDFGPLRMPQANLSR
jgi:dihydrodipicolinate synthase/N-acetylneuraminate lyase